MPAFSAPACGQSGLVWARDLGNLYGVTATPSTQGGVDFAQAARG
jgi:hypothetical protein